MPLIPTQGTPAARAAKNRKLFWPAIVALSYLLLSVLYTHPLLWNLRGGLPVDAGDPGLNAAIFNWNAWTLPFSPAWWNAPQYFPTEGVASFTESMVGFSPFSSPIVWLTGSSVVAYNITIFLTWPLSALAGYFLVWRLTRRHDAAFIAGFAFAFNPFRYYEVGHVQTLATEWMPLALLGLHGYVEDRKTRWLWLFAAAWILNALSNGHFMLFAGVLIGVWLAYFGSKQDTWRPAATVVGVWVVSSLPLLPIFLRYQAIHDYFNLHRHESEIIYYSAEPAAWARISYNIWFWSKFLPDGKDNLFPGVTVLLLIVAAVSLVLWRRRDVTTPRTRLRRAVRALLIAVLVFSVVCIVTAFVWGAWEWFIGEFRLYKMTDINRAVTWSAICIVGLVLMTRSLRDALARRSAFVFYTFGVLLFAVLACGPMLRVGEEVIMSPMPYRWLMSLPGFMELRVPARFWMVSVVCLSTAAGLAYAHLRPARPSLQRLAFVATVGFIMLDCWIPAMPVAGAPDAWPIVEAPGRTEPLLEMPIGPNDYPATFRTGEHHRRLVNGVSGYNPPYYLAIVEGLTRLDPRTLDAVASYAPLDVVITEADDPKGEIRRYISAYPGAQQFAADDRHVAYRLPQGRPEPALGPALSIASVKVRGGKEVVGEVHDGNMETGWGETPQKPDQQVLIDLGTVQDVGGVSLAIGDYYLDFPRHIAVDLSADSTEWKTVWDSPTMGPMMLAWVRAPRKADMRMSFGALPARYVRIRQTEKHFRMWRISEVDVHAPY